MNKIKTFFSYAKAFFVEAKHRFKGEMPFFFKVISWLSIVCFFITGLPETVKTVTADTGVHITLPVFIEDLQNKIVAWCSVVSAILVRFTVIKASLSDSWKKAQDDAAKYTQLGLPESVAVKMPFTMMKTAALMDKALEKKVPSQAEDIIEDVIKTKQDAGIQTPLHIDTSTSATIRKP